MKVICQNCTAPLEVERGSAFAVCSYCGHTNKVKSAQTLMAERPAPPPPVVVPQAVPQPLPRPVRAPTVRRAPKRALNVAGCLPVIFAVVGISVAVFNGLEGTPVWGRIMAFVSPGSNDPTLGTLDLDQPIGAPLRGITTGERSVSGYGDGCRGYIPGAPHVRLHNATEGIVGLDVADSNVDLVMAVQRADGTWWCDDDGGQGTLPRLTMQLPAGDHLVYVGTFSENNTSAFSLRTTWQSVDAPLSPEGIAPDASPSLADVELTPVNGGSQQWQGTTMGGVEARTLHGSCRGAIQAVPHLWIRATGGESVRLTTLDASTDLTLVVRTPSGHYACDDDSGDGLNPAVETVLEAGTTAVWVGVYSGRESAGFTLELDAGGGQGLQPGARAVLGEVNLDLNPSPEAVSGNIRPELEARLLEPTCRGWVGSAPDLSLVTTIPRSVAIAAQGRGDLTLMIRWPDGTLQCDDDSGGNRMPLLQPTLAPGLTEVWVGQIRPRGSSAFQLSVAAAIGS